MATTASKIYMRAEETKRLVKAINALAEREGIAPVDVMPRLRDKELEPIQVIKNMADFIEALLSVEAVSHSPDASDGVIPQRYLDAEQLALAGASNNDIIAAFLSEPATDEGESDG